MKGDEKVSMGENVSVVLQKKLPLKCKDPGMFSISCKIGKMKFDKAMLNLGSSLYVMPDLLRRIRLVMHLADRSCTYPDGVIEDVVVQVDKLVFSIDFFILDMGDASNDFPILLGKPFLKQLGQKYMCTLELSL